VLYEAFSYVDEEKKLLSYWEGSEHASKTEMIKTFKINRQIVLWQWSLSLLKWSE